jgi:hypothetical protein
MKIVKDDIRLLKIATRLVRYYGQFLLGLVATCVLATILDIPLLSWIASAMPWLWEAVLRAGLFSVTLFALIVMATSRP